MDIQSVLHTPLWMAGTTGVIEAAYKLPFLRKLATKYSRVATYTIAAALTLGVSKEMGDYFLNGPTIDLYLFDFQVFGRADPLDVAVYDSMGTVGGVTVGDVRHNDGAMLKYTISRASNFVARLYVNNRI